ncbi:hypothetical protein LGT39_00475 [Demequina sp. TTPB684]|nr:hypothetical protein [Demequina sp. TTPB684]
MTTRAGSPSAVNFTVMMSPEFNVLSPDNTPRFKAPETAPVTRRRSDSLLYVADFSPFEDPKVRRRVQRA